MFIPCLVTATGRGLRWRTDFQRISLKIIASGSRPRRRMSVSVQRRTTIWSSFSLSLWRTSRSSQERWTGSLMRANHRVVTVRLYTICATWCPVRLRGRGRRSSATRVSMKVSVKIILFPQKYRKCPNICLNFLIVYCKHLWIGRRSHFQTLSKRVCVYSMFIPCL